MSQKEIKCYTGGILLCNKSLPTVFGLEQWALIWLLDLRWAQTDGVPDYVHYDQSSPQVFSSRLKLKGKKPFQTYSFHNRYARAKETLLMAPLTSCPNWLNWSKQVVRANATSSVEKEVWLSISFGGVRRYSLSDQWNRIGSPETDH